MAKRIHLFCAVAILFGIVGLAKESPNGVLWVDFDMKNIPEPKERSSGYYEYFFEGQLIEGLKQEFDLPRWARETAGRPKQALNVNALDEVPDSSWYTNRHLIHPMSEADLQRGPNRGDPPDFTTAVIKKAKPSGVTPGLIVQDARGQQYLIKFDPAHYLNLQSGAEVISTKILYAAGYNVPQNYVAYIDRDHLKIGNGVEIVDPKTGTKRPLNKGDIDEMLARVARLSDGRCRVLASKILEGKPKGPFPQVGLRTDDPNDLIPHEHRRELRGLRVIASWINDWDLKEAQSLDMYVEEDGRKFLRHYLLDFGSSLGADDRPTDYYHGHEYGFDLRSITKEIFSLGLYESGNEERALIISPEIGNFTANNFSPGDWKPTYPSVMFSNLTNADAFWATRVILSFSENDLRSIIRTAEYRLPATEEYILHTLLERRRMIAKYWLSRVDALTDFAVRPDASGIALTFRDLESELSLTSPDSTRYLYQVQGNHYKSQKRSSDRPELRLDRETLSAAVERGLAGDPVEVRIWTERPGFSSQSVGVYFDWSPGRSVFGIRRIARG